MVRTMVKLRVRWLDICSLVREALFYLPLGAAMSLTFSFESRFSVPVETLFGWHEQPAALERLNLPWAPFRIIRSSRSIQNGSTVELAIPLIGPFTKRMKVVHEGYEKGKRFQDRQVSGPFGSWLHTHSFRADAENYSILDDTISYSLPFFVPNTRLATAMIESELRRTFWYRHQIVSRDLESNTPSPAHLSFAITGSSGLVGQSLIPFLSVRGHRIVRVLRSPITSSHALWNPKTGELQTEPLEGVDTLVHLAGENIAQGFWTKEKKERIRASRVDGTRRLVSALKTMKNRPKTLIMASAIGLYGPHRSEEVDESSERGDGFLADVVEEWESAAKDAEELGIRVVCLRFGVILSARGGALATMLLPFKGGVGGPLGRGDQSMNWTSIEDVIRVIERAALDSTFSGPYNVVTPSTVTNEQFTKTLGSLLKRPTFLRVPAAVLKATLGEMAKQLLLASTKVVPQRLVASGFKFTDPTIESCLRMQLGCPPLDIAL